MISPEELTTTALETSKADGCIVVLTDTSEVNLRWANSTMTTNGHSTTRSFSVISVVGDSVGVVSGNGAEPEEVCQRAGRPRVWPGARCGTAGDRRC